MLVTNVQETTSTTGTGNVVLGGASESGRTFSSQLATNERFTYYIDDRSGNFESGVGYLSDSVTLVREVPTSGSEALPVNFLAGVKQVFVGSNPINLVKDSLGFSSKSGTVGFMLPSNMVRINTTQALVANRQYFQEAPFSRAVVINSLAAYVSTGGGTSANKMHVGLYEVNPLTGDAGDLVVEVTDLDPSVSGWISGSCPETLIQAGCYILSVWSDVGVTLKANDASIRGSSIFKSSSSGDDCGHDYTSSLSGLSSLPSPAVTTTNNSNGKLTCLAVGSL